MTWKDDLEFSQGVQQYQNDIYRKAFPIKNITRFSKEDRHILDTNYHIDIELELDNGIKLLGQEKALRNKFSGFDTFTIEFYQNWQTKEKGEFFNLGAQFYCHGYMNGDTLEDTTGFDRVYLIKIFDFLEWLKEKPIEELEKNTNWSSGRASFYYIKYSDIPREFIYYQEYHQKYI